MVSFGLITEGPTDQEVIRYVVNGFFNASDIQLNELQPTRGKTDTDKATSYGNWHKVFQHLESNAFRQALEFGGEEYYVIIHIDTDIFYGDSISEEYRIAVKDEAGVDLTDEQIIATVQEKLIESMGREFYDEHQAQIIFAIAHREIECWLLPIYYTNNKKAKTVNCLDTLNQELNKKLSFTIDKNNKKLLSYRKATKPYTKQRTLLNKRDANLSLQLFLNELEAKGIVIEKEDDW